eukprot:CAMPEP_0172451772 /NCGR_PEP_ID=MMETSP1065-20121228/9667_1 /TAXON_ID=265537 /ORGANISM="Amphiprora paludosa, Strain CCMP125" /LENGTH=137 /DNA_ID=CAMNT_0013203743 /DNA_START=30 /DNA_END=440 /DNA_ORIENTATION=-
MTKASLCTTILLLSAAGGCHGFSPMMPARRSTTLAATDDAAAEAKARLEQLRANFAESQSPIVNELPPPVTPVPAPVGGNPVLSTPAVSAPTTAVEAKAPAAPTAVSTPVATGSSKPKAFAIGPDWEADPRPLSEQW